VGCKKQSSEIFYERINDDDIIFNKKITRVLLQTRNSTF